MSETILNKTPAKSADLGEETLMNVYYGDELERYKAIADITTDRLSEICAAERDGRLVVLPCKVGDTVYVVVTDCDCAYADNMNDCAYCDYVVMPCDDFFRYDEDEWECGFKPHVREGKFSIAMYEQLGKTVFLTRAEAEAALKGDSHE
jgi:hypothetical protein